MSCFLGIVWSMFLHNSQIDLWKSYPHSSILPKTYLLYMYFEVFSKIVKGNNLNTDIHLFDYFAIMWISFRSSNSSILRVTYENCSPSCKTTKLVIAKS